MGRVCHGPSLYGPCLLWAEFVWAEFVMGRVCLGPSLLWAELSSYPVINDWAKILDKKGQVDTFILDFEKAFDTPPHELLKSKLFSYGIGGTTLNWINAFLCFRQQRVVVNGIKSDWAPVVSGVPQGTVLGPLLFSLYINDISADIESEIRLFADDCVCYREIKNEEDTLKLQRDIDRLGSWARKWGMRFQPVKCNMMQLTNKRSSKIQANYTLEGTVLENVESIKYSTVSVMFISFALTHERKKD